MAQKKFTVYMLQCADQSLYTGYTIDVERRMAQHCAGKGSAYVRSRRPFRLVFQETWPDKSSAMRREAAIKGMSRQSKIKLAGIARTDSRRLTGGKKTARRRS